MNKPKVVVIGSLNMDIVIQTERHPEVGETLLGKAIRFIPGGKGANQAIAAVRLGADTAMIGAVGEDGFGAEIVSALQAEGVNVDGVKRITGGNTGVASIYVADGDNSIVVVPGANGEVMPDDVDRHRDRIEQADILLLQLEIPVETVLHSVRIAKSLGKIVLLNPAPAQLLPAELFHYVDYFTPNRTELSTYAQMDVDDVEGLKTAMLRMKDMGVAHLITTLGASGSAYLDDAGQVQIVPGYEVPVVDTTGAGDCFNAGLAIAICKGQCLSNAVQYAGAVSALAVTKFGAQAGMPTSMEAQQFIEQHKNDKQLNVKKGVQM